MSESTAGHASAVAAAPAPAGRAATATPACVTFTPQSLFYAPPSLDIEAAAAPARATPVAIDADLVARIRRCFVDTAHASAAESSVVQADPSRRSLEAARFFFLHAQSNGWTALDVVVVRWADATPAMVLVAGRPPAPAAAAAALSPLSAGGPDDRQAPPYAVVFPTLPDEALSLAQLLRAADIGRRIGAVLSRQASPRPPNDAAVAALAATSDAVVLRPSMRFFLSEATGDGDDGNGGRDGEVAVCHASAGPHGVVTYRIERET
ncbi:hypothetical protein CXG81DRAFT_17725 [Caulochytrium protostelioides]|uniref:Uncharacterized protein n=1 Tax=Caulochytrium protostelioides TaxID=1555241 RepID=A0A4P9XBC3_9FUNG|nr:hypothetical protein CXG81DRAFT_17725 [Caulochytrium protostelioides]|eukprot:RKP02672.1 hypothetical protein CXG81DRAFT_17725 [Caulochytrium protostelioides]